MAIKSRMDELQCIPTTNEKNQAETTQRNMYQSYKDDVE
jgi:hypothetical protein